MAEMETDEARYRSETSNSDVDGEFELISASLSPSLNLNASASRSNAPRTEEKSLFEPVEPSAGTHEVLLMRTMEQEQAALREEVKVQNEMLTKIKEKWDELASNMWSMQSRVDSAESELSVERQVRGLAESRVAAAAKEKTELGSQIDKLTAKLIQAEDVVKYQKGIIDHFNSGGSPGPGGSLPADPRELLAHDARLADELNSAEARLSDAITRRVEAESAVLSERERGVRLEKDGDELRGHVTALQVQVVEDRAFIEELRMEIKRLRQGCSSDAFPTVSEEAEATAEAVYRCPNCAMTICDPDLATRHRQGCRKSLS